MAIIKLPGAAHRDEDFSLAPQVVASLWRMEDRHFWHRERNAWILDAFAEYGVRPPARVLEVGCGSGAVSRALEKAGYQVTGVDTAEHLLRKAQERCPAATFVAGDVALLPEGCRGPFDAVGFFDVLEHLDAPASLVRAALRWAKPGALVLATVPALRALHTIIDDLSGHKLRFERGELRQLLEAAGASDVTEFGIFAATLPLQRLDRRPRASVEVPPDEPDRVAIMQRALRVPPFPFNTALGLLAMAERSLGLKPARNRKGASILGVGRCLGG